MKVAEPRDQLLGILRALKVVYDGLKHLFFAKAAISKRGVQALAKPKPNPALHTHNRVLRDGESESLEGVSEELIRLPWGYNKCLLGVEF